MTIAAQSIKFLFVISITRKASRTEFELIVRFRDLFWSAKRCRFSLTTYCCKNVPTIRVGQNQGRLTIIDELCCALSTTKRRSVAWAMSRALRTTLSSSRR
jgi:hypothetical protein